MIVFSAITSTSAYFQWYHIIQTNDIGGVSLLAWFINALSNFIWIFYSVMLRDLAVLVSSVVPFLGCSMILIALWLRQNRHIPLNRVESWMQKLFCCPLD